jgi:hypothetical protein
MSIVEITLYDFDSYEEKSENENTEEKENKNEWCF